MNDGDRIFIVLSDRGGVYSPNTEVKAKDLVGDYIDTLPLNESNKKTTEWLNSDMTTAAYFVAEAWGLSIAPKYDEKHVIDFDNAQKYVDYFYQQSGLTIIVHLLDVIICDGSGRSAPIVKRFLGDEADKFLRKVTKLNEKHPNLDECFQRAMREYKDLCDIFKWLEFEYNL